MNEKPRTVKNISFSSLRDFHYCPHYFNLAQIMGLKPWSNSHDTIFGKWIHAYVQDILQDKITPQEALKQFNRRWIKFCSLYKLECIDYKENVEKIFTNIKQELEKHFPDFKVLSVEERLFHLASEKWPQMFKGFVDIIIQTGSKVVIIDFKTSGSSFFFVKYKDAAKEYQLTLYKHFYSVIKNIDPKNIETYFVVIEKQKSKSPLKTIRITSGPKKVANALRWMNDPLSAINRKIFIKNRTSCLRYGEGHPCYFYRSEHCK